MVGFFYSGGYTDSNKWTQIACMIVWSARYVVETGLVECGTRSSWVLTCSVVISVYGLAAMQSYLCRNLCVRWKCVCLRWSVSWISSVTVPLGSNIHSAVWGFSELVLLCPYHPPPPAKWRIHLLPVDIRFIRPVTARRGTVIQPHNHSSAAALTPS